MKLKRSKGAAGDPTGDAASPDGTDGTPAVGKPGGGRSQLVPAVVLAVGLLGGGFLMRGGGAPSPVAATAAPVEPVPVAAAEAGALGPVVPIEPLTLSLADGGYLKVGLALQLAAPDPAAAEAEGHGAGEEMTAGETAQALDIAVSLLGRHTKAELGDATAREIVKEQLSEQVAEAYHGKVVSVYFTEFVMQ